MREHGAFEDDALLEALGDKVREINGGIDTD